MPFPTYTAEQHAARQQADAILKAAGLPTIKERNADMIKRSNDQHRKWQELDGLLSTVLAATDAHTQASMLVRIMQAIGNDLDKKLSKIVAGHFGV